MGYNSKNNTAALKNITRMAEKVEQGEMDPRTYKQMVDNIPQQDPANMIEATPDDTQYAWISKTLSESDADWKIVFGHFPVRSSTTGEHGDTPNLVKNLSPILSKGGADVYFNGHDHILQHINRDGVHSLGSGAGARNHKGVDKSYTGLMGYLEGEYGFMVHGISKK